MGMYSNVIARQVSLYGYRSASVILLCLVFFYIRVEIVVLFELCLGGRFQGMVNSFHLYLLVTNFASLFFEMMSVT